MHKFAPQVTGYELSHSGILDGLCLGKPATVGFCFATMQYPHGRKSRLALLLIIAERMGRGNDVAFRLGGE